MALVGLLAACNNEPAARKEAKLYTAEQLYNNKSIGGSAFNADETKILVTANITGINNLYELSIADTTLAVSSPCFVSHEPIFIYSACPKIIYTIESAI